MAPPFDRRDSESEESGVLRARRREGGWRRTAEERNVQRQTDRPEWCKQRRRSVTSGKKDAGSVSEVEW